MSINERFCAKCNEHHGFIITLNDKQFLVNEDCSKTEMEYVKFDGHKAIWKKKEENVY